MAESGPVPDGGQRPAPVAMTTEQLIAMSRREFILLVGKDGSGKSSAIVSIARFVQLVLNPGATFFVIDTENKFPTALESFGAEAPTNIQYFKCENMNDVNAAHDVIMARRKAGDWYAAESMSRIWERAQDLGYQTISGFTKAHYLEIRRTKAKSAPVIPRPDDYWNIVKGAHDSGFLDEISQASSLNIVMSTTIKKEPKEGGFGRKSDTREAVKAEFGIDIGVDGAPRLPYYVETFAVLGMSGGRGNCRIVRDNRSKLVNPRAEFDVPTKTEFGPMFFMTCR